MKYALAGVTILIVLWACTPGQAEGGNGRHNQYAIDRKEGKCKVTEDVLRRRFGEFSTAGAFVLVKIQDRATGERAVIVCENTDWFFAAREFDHSLSHEKEYTAYMIRNYGTFLPVPGKVFRELVGSFGAAQGDAYAGDAVRGIAFVAGKYLERFEWSPGGSHAYRVRDRKLAYDRSFLRLLLELGLVVRRDCESGMIYVEALEIDGK